MGVRCTGSRIVDGMGVLLERGGSWRGQSSRKSTSIIICEV